MGEQPLGPYGACLLGSMNLTKFVDIERKVIDYDALTRAINTVVSAMDNVIDNTTYPLPAHKEAACNNRRIGLGCTGLANAVEFTTGALYGSERFLKEARRVFETIRNEAYAASISIAQRRGSFPNLDKEKYLESPFIKTLPIYLQEGIRKYGIRNSHLLSYAPAGTISIVADNVSSGIEPVFSHKYQRTIRVEGEEQNVIITDYGCRVFKTYGKQADSCTIAEHLDVLSLATQYCDSAVSKTINVGGEVTWEEFKNIYMTAWKRGCKGCTTFRVDGKRFGILNAVVDEGNTTSAAAAADGAACYIDKMTGQKECS